MRSVRWTPETGLRAELTKAGRVYEGGPHRAEPQINAILLQSKTSFSYYLTGRMYLVDLSIQAMSNVGAQPVLSP
jgi:hypothetical protein